MQSEIPNVEALADKSDGPRMGRPVGDQKAKKAAFLAAAMQVISENGYGQTSLRDIARKAGYSTGAITYYFSSKDELILAAIDNSFDEQEEFLALNLGRGTIDAETIVRQWLDPVETPFQGTWPVLSQLLASANGGPFAALIETRYSRYRAKLAAIVEEGQRLGIFRADISGTIITDLLCAIGDGLTAMRPIEREHFQPNRIELLMTSIATIMAPA